jgi:hypothetical protein
MSSMLSYFNDRILTPEMMRAMIILYIGPHNRPDFSTDYFLSPVLAPDYLLEIFPKTYFLTGEVDPLLDDTAIFAGRLRQAKAEKHSKEVARSGKMMREFDSSEAVECILLPGVSHGFMQFPGVFPEGWKHIFRCGRWIEECFAKAEEFGRGDSSGFTSAATTPGADFFSARESARFSMSPTSERYHFRRRTESSGEEDLGLEMSMGKRSTSKTKLQDGEEKEKRRVREEKEEREKIRKRKEKLLREHMLEKEKDRKSLPVSKGGSAKKSDKDRENLRRKKSLVGLASDDDLLGRRMLGFVGGLTRTVDEDAP